MSLARRGLTKDAAAFKECALFCEFLDKLKESVSQPSCQADYDRILKKHIKCTLAICKQHSDVPACVDFMTKTSKVGGGFLDWFKKKSTTSNDSAPTGSAQPPQSQPSSAPQVPTQPSIPQAQPPIAPAMVPYQPAPAQDKTDDLYDEEPFGQQQFMPKPPLTDEQRALKDKYERLYEEFANKAVERGLDPHKLLKDLDQIGGKKKANAKKQNSKKK